MGCGAEELGHRRVSLTLSEDALSILVVKCLQVRKDQWVKSSHACRLRRGLATGARCRYEARTSFSFFCPNSAHGQKALKRNENSACTLKTINMLKPILTRTLKHLEEMWRIWILQKQHNLRGILNLMLNKLST